MIASDSSGRAAWAGRWSRRLVEAGHDVRALGRTAEKCEAVSELWAHRPSPSWPRSADGADVVVVCVFTDEQVQQVCLRQRPALRR